jgi:hypothetical protein
MLRTPSDRFVRSSVQPSTCHSPTEYSSGHWNRWHYAPTSESETGMGALKREIHAEAVRARMEVSFPPIPFWWTILGGKIDPPRVPAPCSRAMTIPSMLPRPTNGLPRPTKSRQRRRRPTSVPFSGHLVIAGGRKQAARLGAYRTWKPAATQHVRRRPPECGRGAAHRNDAGRVIAVGARQQIGRDAWCADRLRCGCPQ